ncbi:MAG: potassium transporter TrkA [Clostridiales bacterium]|nr:MAG: potassium transporter TrkA [Clostridiales bacterium]
MKTIIIGGGKIGYYLLKTLREKHYDIVLIEKDKSNCEYISEDIDADIICGDGTDLEVLKDAGIDDAEIVAAVTGADEVNLVICQIAKETFKINKTIARVNNPKNMAMFKALGVDKTVCSTAVISDLIEYEFDKENYKIIQTFERGSMILVEIKIDKKNMWKDCFIKDLEIPGESVFTSVLRNNSAIYPRGNTRIMENDSILVLTNKEGLSELKKQFKNGGMKYEKVKA